MPSLGLLGYLNSHVHMCTYTVKNKSLNRNSQYSDSVGCSALGSACSREQNSEVLIGSPQSGLARHCSSLSWAPHLKAMTPCISSQVRWNMAEFYWTLFSWSQQPRVWEKISWVVWKTQSFPAPKATLQSACNLHESTALGMRKQLHQFVLASLFLGSE